MKRGVLNKKAEITLETLVKNTPQIILFIAAIAILTGMLIAMFTKEKTPAEQDFKRVKEEFDAFIKKEYKGPETFGVPLTARTSNYRIILYQQDEAPAVCHKEPCLCLYDYDSKRQQFIETCAPYPKLQGECTTNCKILCVKETTQADVIRDVKFKIDITRNCGEFRIS